MLQEGCRVDEVRSCGCLTRRETWNEKEEEGGNEGGQNLQ